jgi:outer membrane receptor protein involved in Fe transport
MKFYLKVFFFLVTVQMAWAQNPASGTAGDGKVTGVVKDSTNNEAVEFANVALLDANTGKPVNGDVCDDKGKFTIKNVPDGNYTLAISFIGFKTKKIKVQINDKRNLVDLGNISFSPAVEMLKEIEVQGQKVLVEEKVDRTIYNAENDATAKGGDATDVLRRVPMLSVDLDGNVSLRGSSNLKVLINGKPSTIAANSVADALKQIPSDQIKTVEVITSPSAKYDAEGSAGIINIITKKNTLEGATLNIDGSAGYRGSNMGLSGSYRKGKMGFNLGGFGRSNYNTPGNFYNDQVSKTASTSIIQTADTRTQNLFGNYTLGWDYDINKFNSLQASVKYGVRNGHNFQDHLWTTNYSGLTQTATSLKNVDALNNAGTMDASLNYTKTFAKQGQEFSLLTLYSRNDGTNDFTNTFLDVNNYSITGYRKNTNKSLNQESTIQADFQTPLSQIQILELGAKQIHRQVNSDYQYFNAGSDGAYTLDTNPLLTNSLNYTQNISAGYLAYTLNASKTVSIKAGSRYEYTTITAKKENGSDINIPSYGVFVPSLNISKRLGNGNTLKVAYNRRIQRPSIQFLNPNIQASNPLNITEGNPNLSPEYSNNYEVSYSALIKSVTMNVAAFYRNTDNAIQSVRDISGDTVRTTFKNIGLQDAYGVNLFLNINLSNKFSLNAGTDTYYAVLKNNSNDIYSASNTGWVSNFRLFGNYNLNNGWGLQFFGFYRGTQVQLQGYQGGFRMYSLSVKKDFANKKGSIGAGMENFFTPTMKIQNYSESSVLVQDNYNTLYNFSFKVNFSYRIGKMSMNNPPRRNKKSINNDDLKEGGDQGDGGGAQQGGGGAPQGGGGQRPQGAGNGQRPAGTQPGNAQQVQGQNPTQWPGLNNGQQKPGQEKQPAPENSKKKKKKEKKEEKKNDNSSNN